MNRNDRGQIPESLIDSNFRADFFFSSDCVFLASAFLFDFDTFDTKLFDFLTGLYLIFCVKYRTGPGNFPTIDNFLVYYYLFLF